MKSRQENFYNVARKCEKADPKRFAEHKNILLLISPACKPGIAHLY